MEVTDYVSYELAVKLKACGFDEPCEAFYEHINGKMYFSVNGGEDWNSGVDYSAPLLYHAQKWLRERAIEIVVTPIFSRGGRDGYDWDVYDDFSDDMAIRGPLPLAETYESALSVGIAAALELIKKGE